MKKTFFLTLVFFLFSLNYTNAQLSKFVKNVKNNVKNDIIGGGQDQNQSTGKKTLPEPACSCADATPIVDLAKNKLDYNEISFSSDDDGDLLITGHLGSEYYIVKDGMTKGPYVKGDPALAPFGVTSDDNKESTYESKYKGYVIKSGDKYLINFMGKTYGPYAMINQFVLNKTRDKFIAMVTENLVVTEDQSKKLEAEIKNAKTDEEKMNISMKYAQDMGSKMMGNGGASAYTQKFITNISGAVYDPEKAVGAQFSGNLKYGDILMYSYNKVMDLNGNLLLTNDLVSQNANAFFISSDNSRWAIYNYGTLTMSDNSKLSDLFNLHWLKADGKVYLAYMYYSPKKNSILQCKIPF